MAASTFTLAKYYKYLFEELSEWLAASAFLTKYILKGEERN